VNVNGRVTAQYNLKFGPTMALLLPLQSNRGMEKSEATKVPGRKSIVTIASVFMAEESLFEYMAIILVSLASSRLTRASLWAIILES